MVKSLQTHGLVLFHKTQSFWIALLVISLGIFLGFQFALSNETVELVGSIIFLVLLLPFVISRPLTGLLLLVVLTAFIEEWVEIPLGAGIPDLSFSRFIIAFMGIAMLAKAAVGRFRFVTPLGWADVAIVLTLLGIMSSAPLADSPTGVLQNTLSRFLTPMVLYFFARNFVRSREDLQKVLYAILIFGVLASLYAVYEYTTGHILFVSKETSVEDLNTAYTASLRLIRGLLGRSGNFGRVLASTIPVSFYLFFEQKQARLKLLLIAAIALQFFVLFISYNRASWYAVLISLSIIQLFYAQFRKLYILIVLVAGLALWATWDQINESTVVQERVDHRTENFNGRTPRWQAAYNMWKEKPIRGWGPDAFKERSGQFRIDGSSSNFRDGAIENDYLSLMVETGLLGLIPYLLFLLVPLFNSIYLFFLARSPDWTGFVKADTITIYWCAIISFLITSYTQIQSQAVVRMLPFVLAGAIVGSHLPQLSAARRSRRLKDRVLNKVRVPARSLENSPG